VKAIRSVEPIESVESVGLKNNGTWHFQVYVLPMKLNLILLWEQHLAAMIVAGSHSHKGDTSLPTGWHSAP
jgi:hypothetical protein